MRFSNSFALSLIALLSETVLAWFGKPTGAATVAAGLYVGARAGLKGSNVWAASKDEKCDTSEIIKSIEK